MKEIFIKDVREIDEFERIHINYRKVEQTDRYMVWEMTRGDKVIGWEIWKPYWRKNPDGVKVWAKPNDELFGTLCWYCTSKERLERRKSLLSVDDNNEVSPING